MDNVDQTETTENPASAEQTESNNTKTSDTISVTTTIEGATTAVSLNEEHDNNQLISSNGKVEAKTDISVSNPITATDTIVTKENTDPVPDSVAFKTVQTKVKNSLSLKTDQTHNFDAEQQQQQHDKNTLNDANVELSSLDAALDNLSDQVASLLDDASTSNVKSNSPDAPLDEALTALNRDFLGLLKESRKIQDELKKASDAKEPIQLGSRCGSSQGIDRKDGNQFFDYSLYRETSQSPPPHPLITYRWEDIRRDKEKGGYPWTYLNPQDLVEQPKLTKTEQTRENQTNDEIASADTQRLNQLDQAEAISFQIEQQTLELPTSLLTDSNAPPIDLLSFNFDNIDTQRAIDSYSAKSSVKNSSSGILEVLQDLEAEDARPNECKKQNVKASTTQSHQDLTTFKPKEESKRFALRSLLKRTHSAPKKIQVTKPPPNDLDEREKSPQQVKCCHPIVEKLKTMADKQLHKKSPKKESKTVKTVSLPKEKKIVLAEQTRIIRLKDSPKAERKNVAAYLEKRDSDDAVEIVQLEESPSESRKRREDSRKAEELEKVKQSEIEREREQECEREREREREHEKRIEEHKESRFVVPPNVTGVDTDPTVEELLEEEFKNDPPKKAPRKNKEHIYEEIEAPGAITQLKTQKLGKPANLFACAVLHSVLNKDEFKEGLKRQNEIEDADEETLVEEHPKPMQEKPIYPNDKDEKLNETADAQMIESIDTVEGNSADSKPIPDEVIELNPANETTTTEIEHFDAVKEQSENESDPVSSVQITINESVDIEKSSDETDKSNSDAKKDVFVKEEKKVKFSQSTEDRYLEKLAAETDPNKEDVELPEQIKVSKRWSKMSDHEYEPIGEPIVASQVEQIFERPAVKINEPESPSAEALTTKVVYVEEHISIDGTESPIRSITPFTDISRTEDVHTSQIDDSAIEELPLRREDRKKKSFMTNAGETSKNIQNKISSQAMSLRTKFKCSLKSGSGSSQKASGSNLKSSLKSSPKTSQTSPKERKKFKRIDFTNKLKSIHLPKVSKPELPKFKMPDKFKLSRNEAQTDAPTEITTTTITSGATVDEPSNSALGTDGTPTIVSITTEEFVETRTQPKKRFEFGSYPKIFNRFKSQPTKSDENEVNYFMSEGTDRDTATQPSSSSFSTHFATVPRTASKIKNSIISKWNKTTLSRSTDHEDNESIPQGSIVQHDDGNESILLASKITMEDEEEPLGILQTKEQIQLAHFDEENRAIHEISRAREKEFKARKPLVHQDSDLVSEESNRDIDWEECERIRNKIMGSQRTPTYEYETEHKRDSHGRRNRNDSNFSTEETQSSGSSGDRRRTGVIEDIDDDEFFLRQRGVSQDNAEISKYISSAIREGHASYSYDNNDEFQDDYRHFDERPRKPLRRRMDGFNRSFESYDDYRHERLSDNEVPVATQYFPRHEDENISFYDNDFPDDIDNTNILARDEQYESDIENDEFRGTNMKPKVPQRKRKSRIPPKQDSIETNEEVLIYRSEPSFTVPVDEPTDVCFVAKPARKNRLISSKSDLQPEHQDSFDREPSTIEKSSPNNSRYTINIKDTNGYATVKKDPASRPPAPARRRKRSTKSLGDTLQTETSKPSFKDSPFPERQKRGYNIVSPARPPRRGSSSSLVDQYKPPSIAPSDGTQYEEIDDELDNEDNEQFYPPKIDPQNRPLPAPPRPPREKRRRRKTNVDKKFDDDGDAEMVEMVAGSFDDSEFSTREFVGAEMATQTSLDIDDLYLNEDVPADDEITEQYTKTVEEILRGSDTQTNQTKTPSDDNLMKGIQKFRESNQRSYSERSRASTERQSSRPITPSTLLIEQRIARSPIRTDAALIMQPINDPAHPDYRTDSAESEYVPYVDEIDDTQIDTEDERIIDAAIRRYQYHMLSSESNEHSSDRKDSPPKTTNETNVETDKKSTIEVPQPPPRRKSSASTSQITETITVPLAEPETLSVASTQELNRFTPDLVNDLSAEHLDPTHTPIESLTVVNFQAANPDHNNGQKPDTKVVSSNFQITPEVMREIIERVRETMPVQTPDSQSTHAVEGVPIDPEVNRFDEPISKNNENQTEPKEETKQIDEPPERPPTPTNYTVTTEIPASFYRLRTGISEDESSIPPSAIPKHRPRKLNRRPESSSDEECSRRHHHHHVHHPARGQDLSIADLSGQLIRACGRALSSSLNTAGHSLFDFLRSLTKNQDDQQKDLSLVLLIIIIIVASLMMLGISGDRSVHHHHWDYFNPPDNIGRR